VLKRGVERFVLDEAVAIARSQGARWLVGEYLPTAKNVIVKDHYEKLGFSAWDGRWRLDVSTYEPKSAHFQKVT
jgi:predicted enzyme involved in methoxymalonyl-ACP biosynthesis